VSIPTILVIEDNQADIFILRHAFDASGEPYELEILTDGESAIAFVAEHRTGSRKPEPCVILLDLHLPKYNGIEVLSAIRHEPPLSHIHVVVLTSRASPHEEKRVTELGGVCCLKPTGLDATKLLAAEIIGLCQGRVTALTSAVN